MTGDSMTAELAALLSRGYEAQNLAARVALCSDRVARVLASFREIQLLEWQSPAGRAYRNTVALQEVALGRVRMQLEDALTVVTRYSHEATAVAPSQTGQFPWPR